MKIDIVASYSNTNMHDGYWQPAWLIKLGSLALIFFSHLLFAGEAIKYHVAERLNDPQKDYYITLLQQACIVSEPQYGTCNLQPVMASMHQGRQMLSLDRDILSIMWTVTNNERESRYLPVRIPLTMGLIGARIAVYHEGVDSYFSNGAQLKPIRELASVQGHDWPDLPILSYNQFNVAGINWNDSVYRMLSKRVFDVVYRSVLEIDAELEQQNEAVIKDQHHLFYYPSAIYFFVSKKNPLLYERIEYGLNIMVKTGKLKQLLLEDPLHRSLKKMLFEDQRKVHFLENPYLPETTPIEKRQYWLFNRE